MPSSAYARTQIHDLSLHDALPIFKLALRISAEPFPNREFIVSEPLRVLKSERCSPRPEFEDSEPVRDLKKEFCSATLEVEPSAAFRSEEHTSELQSRGQLVCRLLLMRVPKFTICPYTTLFRSLSWLLGSRLSPSQTASSSLVNHSGFSKAKDARQDRSSRIASR